RCGTAGSQHVIARSRAAFRSGIDQGRRHRRSKGCSCCLLKSCILWALDFLLVLKHRSRCFLIVSRRRRFLGRFPILLWATRETRFRTSPLLLSADSEAGWRFAIVITAIGARIP